LGPLFSPKVPSWDSHWNDHFYLEAKEVNKERLGSIGDTLFLDPIISQG